MKRWSRHPADASQHADHQRFSNVDTVLNELATGELDMLLSGCAICLLRDALDRKRTMRWLFARQQVHHGTPDALGVACCPLHIWRLYELVATSAPLRSSISTISPSWTRSVRDASSRADRQAHAVVADILARTVDSLHSDLLALRERFSQTGLRDRLVRLRGDLPPGLLWLRPDCPICESGGHSGYSGYSGHAVPAETYRTSGQPEQQVTLVYDMGDARVYEQFAQLCAALSSAQRRVVAERLCSHDRQLSYLSVRQFEEFPPPVRHHAAGTLPTLPHRWIAPAGMEDSSFVARLLRDDVRDIECPACQVRAEHEAALIVEVRDAVAGDTQHGAVSLRDDSSGEPRVNVEAAIGVLDDVCPRHQALLFDVRNTPTPTVPAPVVLLASRGPGSLRKSYDDACVVCTAVKGWDLARLEGLRRAAGGALLYEDVTRRLRQALAVRQHGLCLPHWQQATATAEREVTRTLLDLELRNVSALRAVIAGYGDAPRTPNPRLGDDDGGADAAIGLNPYMWAALALGGRPA